MISDNTIQKKIEKLLQNAKAISDENSPNSFTIKTVFGYARIHFSLAVIPAFYIQFQSLNIEEFEKMFGDDMTLNKHSLKWNFYGSKKEYVQFFDEIENRISKIAYYGVYKDYISSIKKTLDNLIESHTELFKDRYYCKTKKEVEFDLNVNHDLSCDIDFIKSEIGRELSQDEYTDFEKKFNKGVLKKIFP